MKSKIFIGIPLYRYFEPPSYNCLRNIIETKKDWVLTGYLELQGCSLISRARNVIADKFLKSEADYLFSMDTDIICYNKENPIDMLVNAGLDIIGGGYVYKQYPVQPAFRMLNGEFDLRTYQEPVMVKYVSSGFILLSRDIVTGVSKITGGFPFIPMVIKGEYLSEDWAFCERAWDEKRCGSYIHPKIDLAHLGTYPYSMTDFYRFYIDTGFISIKKELRNDMPEL